MRFDRLDLNLLVALDTLINRCNVSLAAKDLCLSQSAMSGALNRLRDYFEDDLLVQSGRKMLLTPRGRELAQPVREALLFVRRNITTSQRFDPATSERCFHIVGSDYVHQILLADAIRDIAHEAPHVAFRVSSPDRAVVEKFGRGEVDLFISVDSPVTGLLDEHPSTVLFEDEEMAVCWQENEACRDGLTLEAFANLGHVAVNFGPDQAPAASELIFERNRIVRKIEVVLPSFSYIPITIIGTQRIATMHGRQARYFARFLPIKVMPIPLEIPKIREVAIWNAAHGNDAGLQWLRERLVQAAAPLTIDNG